MTKIMKSMTNVSWRQSLKTLALTAALSATMLTTQAQQRSLTPPTLTPLTSLKGIHPWWGARVAFFGDSLTDPRNNGSKKKYWNYLQEMLGITPYIYGVSGRQWNDIPRQIQALLSDHGRDFDAIVILMGTNDYNHGVKIGQWYDEKDTTVYAAVGQPKTLVKRRYRTMSYDAQTYRGRINIAMKMLKDSFTLNSATL